MRLLFTALACWISVSLSAQELLIGDTYQGGIVFYLDDSGGGLIAAPSDQSGGAEWGCYELLIQGANDANIGAGNQNTIDIITGCSQPEIAAVLCSNLTLNGYDDWFLPSKAELNLMYVNLSLQGLGDFSVNNGPGTGLYWSSTQSDSDNAWEQNFNNGFQGNNAGKVNTNNVRAIRAFSAPPVLGCLDPNALNYDPDATEDDGSCLYSTLDYDGNGDGCVDGEDLLNFLQEYGQCD